MKYVFGLWMVIVVVGCQTAPPAPVAPVSLAGVSYEGGDGSSVEQAVVIKGATERTGVPAEYAWVAQRFPGYRKSQRSLHKIGNELYELLDFTTAGGEQKRVYFDITDFYGQF